MERIYITDSIDNINKDDWDKLVVSEIFLNFGWLKTLEETYLQDFRYRYILLFDAEKLVGAVFGYIAAADKSVANIDNHLFGRLTPYAGKFRLSFLPALVCDTIFSTGVHFLICQAADPRRKAHITEKLLYGLEKEAKKLGLPLIFPHVATTEPDLINLLRRKRYCHTRIISGYQLDLTWKSFEGYLEHIKLRSKNMARHIRRELKINACNEVQIRRINNPAPYCKRFL